MRTECVVVTFLLLPACGRHSSAASLAAQPEPSASSFVQKVTSTGASDSSSPPVSVPSVRVENIGIHIGGGPNDSLTKAPIASSVAPHFDELRACWASVDEPQRGTDFGVDLLIPSEGGHAKVSNPRTGPKGDAFRACVVAVFEAIEFKKPLTGRTTVSYSLRFTPQ